MGLQEAGPTGIIPQSFCFLHAESLGVFMGWIKSFISLSLLLIPVAVGAILGIRNPELVTLDLVVWRSSEYSLGILLMVTLLSGYLLGVMAKSLWLWPVKRQRNKLKKQLDSAVKRFEQLQ